MSKRSSRKRGGRSTSPFVMLHWHLIDSQGWHALSPHARLAYLELARLYSGDNNGCISLSARRLARQMPCDKATASRALRELEDAGFIETLRVGTFTRKDRLASEYRLCNYTCDVTGDLPKRNWNCLRWKSSEGTIQSYRTGAQTRQRGAKLPSTVSLNCTVKPQTEYSTVREDRTHLDFAMGARPKEHAAQEAEDQTSSAASLLKRDARTSVVITHAKFSPAGEEGFPELPDFLRRVR